MNKAVLDFLERMRGECPEAFRAGRVLECGSLDINGSPRGMFAAGEYVGLDWRPGKGVDVVSLIHEYRSKPDGYFSTVVSTSMIEHDPYWWESLLRMTELLARGGHLIVTLASPAFPRHKVHTSPQKGYYRAPELSKIMVAILLHANFSRIIGEVDGMMTFAFFAGKR